MTDPAPVNELANRGEGHLATIPQSELSIAHVLQTAVEKGASPESLEKLVALYERMKANSAAEQFADAKAAFARDCPPIPRRSANAFFQKVGRDGVKGPHMYASLEDIADTIKEPLARHGLSYRWGDAIPGVDMVVVPCIVSHRAGHSESASVPMPLDSKAGCSPQQKYGIAFTYAQRYSLIAALGLTSCEDDADGNGPTVVEYIDANAQANLSALLDDAKADRAAFLEWVGAASLDKVPKHKFAAAVARVQEKIRRNAEGGR